jgi:hypothetical protein
VIIHTTRPSISTPSEAAQYSEADLRLRDKQSQKFVRCNGGTNKHKLTQCTLTSDADADAVIGKILDSNDALSQSPSAQIENLAAYLDLGAFFMDPTFSLSLPSEKIDRMLHKQQNWLFLTKSKQKLETRTW